MKQVTLNFREVAVDGLPKESGRDFLVIHDGRTSTVDYSAKHKMWNTGDWTSESEAHRHGDYWVDVTHWVPVNELVGAIKGGETP